MARGSVNNQATLADVARVAGVSQMTASRALHNKAKVRRSTLDKVMAAVEQIGYRPNLSARQLASARSFTLGLFCMAPNSAYQGQLLLGALRQSRRLGYHMMVETPGADPDEWAGQATAFYLEARLDGIMLPPPLSDNPDVRTALNALNANIVCVSSAGYDDVDATVSIDEFGAAREMTQHLIRAGHSQIGFLKGAENQTSSQLRLDGFLSAMSASGLKAEDAWIQGGNYEKDAAEKACALILQDPANRPTAIFASNDEMAAAAYAVAWRKGLRVPEDLSVTGFDDTDLAYALSPGLTTVHQPIIEIAESGVELLATLVSEEGLAGREAHQTLPHQLVKRESVSTPGSPD